MTNTKSGEFDAVKKQLLEQQVDSLALLGHISYELSCLRRYKIKSVLKPEYVSFSPRIKYPCSEWYSCGAHSSISVLTKYLDLDRDNFTKYVVCPKCTKCYHYNECFKQENGRTIAKLCSNVSFLRGKPVKCNSKLVKKVVLKNNQTKYYPIYYYCYNGIINSLEEILSRAGLPEKCEKWRGLHYNCMTDIYDGKLWNDFQTVKGKDFLNSPRNYGLMLNFDFFQPMKHTHDYSVGVALSSFAKCTQIRTIQMGKCNRNWNTKYGKRTEMPK